MSNSKAPLLVLVILFLTTACAPEGGAARVECDSAIFIDHVILDTPVEVGTIVMPGLHFTKTWRVQNDGDCSWTTDYALVQVAGSELGAPEEQALEMEVAAGENVDISVALTTPREPGSHHGEWMLRNPSGVLFGVGADGDAPLITDFRVVELPAGTVYVFDQVHCLAVWHSNIATFLPCEGGENEEDVRIGYVRVVGDALLEDSNPNNLPVIEVKPNNQEGGWITGLFPPLTIQEGDHFLAGVGCLGGNPDCSIIFQLEYQLPDGSIGGLGEWSEVYDKETGHIDVDLSDLAGQSPRLILRVEENGGRSLQAIGYWQDARIERPE